MQRQLRGLAAATLASVLLSGWASPKGSALWAWGGAAASSNPAEATALDLKGKEVDPFALSSGKTLVLIFVRTDCPISNRYAPTIQGLSKKYAGGVSVMLVYPDQSETPQNIEKHLHDFGYTNTALRDPQHTLVKLGQVQITPEAAVFNAQHELVYHGRIDNWYKDFGRARPAPTTHELNDAIQAALHGTAPPQPVGGVGCYISDLQ